MQNVYVLGTGMIKFGRYPTKTVPELGGEAAIIALKDAGITIKDVEMFACGNLYQSNAMVGQRILQQIGQTGIPVINVANACATGSTALREAYMAVASGMYDVAMAVGVEQMGKQGLLGGGGGGSDPAYSAEGRLGSGLMPAVFGQAGIEHMRKYGTRMEHFAKISVKSHQHATKNPFSQYRNEVTLEDVLNARMISYPNTLYMCCPTGDGAAAAVVAGARARLPHGNGTNGHAARVELVASRSRLWPATLDVMGWNVDRHGLHVVFSRDIPTIVREWVRPNLEEFLGGHDLSLETLGHVVAHPGGPRVLAAYAEALGLSERAFRHAYDVLRECGNMSSPTCLFVLERFLSSGDLSPGEAAVLAALGPGFSSELVLMRGVA